MGHIFCMMGKSASGKDSLYAKLLNDENLDLKRIVPYTTRPVRAGEKQGEQYYFTSFEELEEMESQGIVIERRVYNTYHGDWHYFTVDDGGIDLEKEDYIVIGTIESYENFKKYFGAEKVIPFYIEVEDGIRLERALNRERQQQCPKYEEMCRRFLADAKDFAEDKIVKAGITTRYQNDNFEDCLQSLRECVWRLKSIK